MSREVLSLLNQTIAYIALMRTLLIAFTLIAIISVLIWLYIMQRHHQKQLLSCFEWPLLGYCIKQAYITKYDNNNPEFNKEVDQHIAIMYTQSKGSARQSAESWLKRHMTDMKISWIE